VKELPFNKISSWTPRYTRERLKSLIEYYSGEAATARDAVDRIRSSGGRRGATYRRMVEQEDRARCTKECLWAIYSRLENDELLADANSHYSQAQLDEMAGR
jgi:hypothetical protein